MLSRLYPIQRLQRILKRKKMRSFLVTSNVNLRYLTGVDCSAGCMVITPRYADLYLDPRYHAAASGRSIPGVRIERIDALRERLKNTGNIHIEGDLVTLTQLSRWKKRYKNTKFVQTSGLIEELRRSKSVSELSNVKRACSITLSILKMMPRLLKSGMSERELSMKIEALALKLGAESMAFPTIVGFGENTAFPHHHPTERRLKRGDIVQIDLGVKVNGYCSDYSRVFFTTQPTKDQRTALQALKKAKSAAEQLVRSGRENSALDLKAREVLATFGLENAFTHALGHGVGLEIHEGLSISKKAKRKKLLRNEVITIEPGVYFPGKWGMRIEDTIVVV
ncbi:MAG: Xaa-Pro peptidase family protein [Candidatus Peribacteraceae bacterium]|nr:Xaa-Pro peptidase family protein [Candidatus Peribacteraceae bacterium]